MSGRIYYARESPRPINPTPLQPQPRHRIIVNKPVARSEPTRREDEEVIWASEYFGKRPKPVGDKKKEAKKMNIARGALKREIKQGGVAINDTITPTDKQLQLEVQEQMNEQMKKLKVSKGAVLKRKDFAINDVIIPATEYEQKLAEKEYFERVTLGTSQKLKMPVNDTGIVVMPKTAREELPSGEAMLTTWTADWDKMGGEEESETIKVNVNVNPDKFSNPRARARGLHMEGSLEFQKVESNTEAIVKTLEYDRSYRPEEAGFFETAKEIWVKPVARNIAFAGLSLVQLPKIVKEHGLKTPAYLLGTMRNYAQERPSEFGLDIAGMTLVASGLGFLEVRNLNIQAAKMGIEESKAAYVKAVLKGDVVKQIEAWRTLQLNAKELNKAYLGMKIEPAHWMELESGVKAAGIEATFVGIHKTGISFAESNFYPVFQAMSKKFELTTHGMRFGGANTPWPTQLEEAPLSKIKLTTPKPSDLNINTPTPKVFPPAVIVEERGKNERLITINTSRMDVESSMEYIVYPPTPKPFSIQGVNNALKVNTKINFNVKTMPRPMSKIDQKLSLDISTKQEGKTSLIQEYKSELSLRRVSINESELTIPKVSQIHITTLKTKTESKTAEEPLLITPQKFKISLDLGKGGKPKNPPKLLSGFKMPKLSLGFSKPKRKGRRGKKKKKERWGVSLDLFAQDIVEWEWGLSEVGVSKKKYAKWFAEFGLVSEPEFLAIGGGKKMKKKKGRKKRRTSRKAKKR